MATANEMKYQFLLYYDKLFTYGAPAYDDTQIASLLTKAQNRIYREYYGAFDTTEQKRKDFDELLETGSISGGEISESADQTGIHPNGVIYDLPSDFEYAVEENAKMGGSEVLVKPIKHDYYSININNPYKKPYGELIWRMDKARVSENSVKRVELISDGTTITDYRIVYLKQIPAIVIDETTPANQVSSVLDSSLHDQIVDEAVKIARAAINTDDYQIPLNERKENKI